MNKFDFIVYENKIKYISLIMHINKVYLIVYVINNVFFIIYANK